MRCEGVIVGGLCEWSSILRRALRDACVLYESGGVAHETGTHREEDGLLCLHADPEKKLAV